MRLLHTSDWHLGRGLHGLDLGDAQESFIDSLLGQVREQRPDVVLISGDVFDRAVPPVESVQTFERALHALGQLTCVIVIAGNHDSAIRLGYGSSLYRDGITVATDISQCGTPVVITDEHGPVAFYPIPYLDPDHARSVLAPDDELLPRSHQAVMAAAMARVTHDLESRRIAKPSSSMRSVVLAHAFVVGGAPSDSERDIRVGGVDSVSVETFAGIDYVALGHLHGPQAIDTGADSSVVRYSGSPLRYSFSEANQRKSLTLIDMDRDGRCTVELLPLPQPRQMVQLVGALDEVIAPDVQRTHGDSWVRIVVTDAARPQHLNDVVRAAFPHALSIVHSPPADSLSIDITANRPNESTVDPVDISREFVLDVTNAPATDDEITVYRRAYESIR